MEFSRALGEAAIAALRQRIEEEPEGRHAPGEYPLGREREPSLMSLITRRYYRYEATAGFLSVGDSYGQVIEFSSLPDAIELFVLDQSVDVQFLADVGGRNEPITIPANLFYEPGIVYRSLIAKNTTAGLTGRIQVVAKWAY